MKTENTSITADFRNHRKSLIQIRSHCKKAGIKPAKFVREAAKEKMDSIKKLAKQTRKV